MQFRDLKAQYEALKSDIDAAMTQVHLIVILLAENR